MRHDLSETLREAHPEVPWTDVVAMRNVLVHHYFTINLRQVWNTVEIHVPELREDPERKRVVWEALSVITAEMPIEAGRTYGGGLHKLEPKELGNVDAQRLVGVLPELRSQSRTRQPTLF